MGKVFLVESIKEKITLKDWEKLKKKGYSLVLSKTMGLDHIIKQAPRKGLSDYCSDDIAEWVLQQTLNLVRHQKCNFKNSQEDCKKGYRLKGKKALVIGSWGNIGLAVKPVLYAIGMNVFGVDVKTGLKEYNNNLALHLPDVFLIVLCVPGETKNVLNKKDFEKMKAKPFIVNPIGRQVFSHSLLKTAISTGKIRGYAYDNILNNGLEKSRLVITTPHIGAWTKEAQQERDVQWKKLLANETK